MVIWLIISGVLTIGYFVLIIIYIFGWLSKDEYQPSGHPPKTKVAVLVPARNEEAHISKTIGSILAQTYPDSLYEILIIDDHSEDRTAELVNAISAKNLKLLDLKSLSTFNKDKGSFKKQAIATAIDQTDAELIITTDADCLAGPEWISTIVDYYETHDVKLITGPVIFHQDKNLIQKFQNLDFSGMMLLTGASDELNMSNMCNGANLAYSKEAFLKVDGFSGIMDNPSGDDLMLMHKIDTEYPAETVFLKSEKAIVKTLAPETFKEFTQQRLRWASKSRGYKDSRIRNILALVLFFNLSILVNLILGIIGYDIWPILKFQFINTFLVNFVFLYISTRYFKRKDLLSLFLPAQIAHILYIVGISIMSTFMPYTWKGRRVQNK